MSAWIVPCVLAGIATGPLFASIPRPWLRRLLGWLTLVALLVTADSILSNAGAWFRMVGICCVLLGSLKSLVYAEWAANGYRLPWHRYLVFCCFWFGMDPGTFRTRRQALAWKGDLTQGAACTVIGLIGTWLVAFMQWHHVFLMFLPLSLAFHFGVLRMLKSVWRACGFPVRTLFPNLLLAQGFADFWSQRWNVGYSQMMQRVVGRPVATRWGRGAGVLAVFIVSGLLHELAITVPVRSGYGLPTLYFFGHGCLTLLEQQLGRPLGKYLVLAAVILPLGILFPTEFQREIFTPCFTIFDRLLAFR